MEMFIFQFFIKPNFNQENILGFELPRQQINRTFVICMVLLVSFYRIQVALFTWEINRRLNAPMPEGFNVFTTKIKYYNDAIVFWQWTDTVTMLITHRWDKWIYFLLNTVIFTVNKKRKDTKIM